MFRCITEIKGLVFDIDSFEEDEIDTIVDNFEKYELLFMTSSENMAQKIERKLGEKYVYKMEGFQRFLAPNHYTHTSVLKILNVLATELVYVSKRIDFLKNAMGFIGGTAWITDTINYEDVGNSPDLICKDLQGLDYCLNHRVDGFLGEMVVYPDSSRHTGMIVPAEFDSEIGSIPMYVLGRYFGYSQYMNQLHPFSSAIYLNKSVNRKSYGTFNDTFERLISVAVGKMMDNYEIDGICSVPPRPGKTNRFEKILENVSIKRRINNYGPRLVCIEDYPSQKSCLSYQERQENIKGVFSVKEKFHGERIIIIDDVITTGATMNECIKTLKNAGAGEIFIVVLAVNQQGTNYWSSNEIYVPCPGCKSKMHLLINSNNKSFFYSCYECN